MFNTLFFTTTLLLASSAIASPLWTRAGVDNGSCQQMQHICELSVDQNVTKPWSHEACLLGASCFGGQRPVDGFLASVFDAKGNSANATNVPTSLKVPRVPLSVFKKISTDGKTVSQQNWIDGYYHTLDSTGGPYPSGPDVVISDFNRLQSWTGFCGRSIPYQNFADYYQYSSTVNSAAC